MYTSMTNFLDVCTQYDLFNYTVPLLSFSVFNTSCSPLFKSLKTITEAIKHMHC